MLKIYGYDRKISKKVVFLTFMEYFVGGPQTRYRGAPQWVNFSPEQGLPKNHVFISFL